MSVDVILEDERWRTLDLEGCSQAAFDLFPFAFEIISFIAPSTVEISISLY